MNLLVLSAVAAVLAVVSFYLARVRADVAADDAPVFRQSGAFFGVMSVLTLAAGTWLELRR